MSHSESRLLNRRNVMQIGSAGMFGVSLPNVLKAAANNGLRKGAAKRCVLFFLVGGRGQQDMWDLKPDAPAEIRGDFEPISTAVPGIQIGDVLPKIAGVTDRMSILRSMTPVSYTHLTLPTNREV